MANVKHVPMNIPKILKKLTLAPDLPLSLSSTISGANAYANDVHMPFVVPRNTPLNIRKMPTNVEFTPLTSR